MEIFCLGNHSLKTRIFTPVCLHNFCLGSHSSKTQLFTKVLPQSTNHGLWHIRNPWMDMGKRGMSPAAETLSTRNQKLAQKTFVYGKDENRLKKTGSEQKLILLAVLPKFQFRAVQMKSKLNSDTLQLVFHETSYSSQNRSVN